MNLRLEREIRMNTVCKAVTEWRRKLTRARDSGELSKKDLEVLTRLEFPWYRKGRRPKKCQNHPEIGAYGNGLCHMCWKASRKIKEI